MEKRDGGMERERNGPDKSGTKDKGKRSEKNRNRKTMRRKDRELCGACSVQSGRLLMRSVS